jgi:hypothetical protein
MTAPKLEDTPRIINGTWRLEVRQTDEFESSPVTLIPSYPDLPMEKVYPRVSKTGKAEIYLRDFTRDVHGRGRVVYFPWDIDRTFWEVLCVDHFKLLRNAVEWATDEEMPATVSGAGVLDVTVWRQKTSLTVHLVNLTNPMMMKGPIRELIPIGPQRVRIRIPDGTNVRQVHLLAAGKTPPVERSRRFLAMTVPTIRDHEVIAVDL